MLKLSRTGIGLLSAQYRSVLKKCLFLNLAMAGFFISTTPAFAAEEHGFLNANADITISNILNSDFGQLINAPSVPDGIHSASNVIAQGLAVSGANDTYRINNLSSEAWLRNEGTIAIGYTFDYADPTSSDLTEYSSTSSISDMHNVGTSSRVNAGSVLMNNDVTRTYNDVPFDGYLIKINNTEFSDNTKSYFSTSANNIYGGVIGNVRDSDTQNKAEITNSNFSRNYVMSNANIMGGVLYNGSTETKYGTNEYKASNAYIVSSNNIYDSNGAYNNDLGVTSGTLYDDVVKEWVETYDSADAQNAYGGVIYNESTLRSTEDTFSNNRAIAQTEALGGAIYNKIETYTQSEAAGGGTWTTKGIVNIKGGDTFASFTGNSVTATSDSNAEAQKAAGGAVYNQKGTITVTGDVRFFNNTATSNVGLATGGAIVTNEGSLSFEGNQDFSNNQALTISGKAYGGALSGLQSITQNTGTQTFSNNNAVSGGGAIANASSTLINTGTQIFTSNTASGMGGGILNTIVTAAEGIVTNTGTQTFISNSAQLGGAIYNDCIMTNNGTQLFSQNTAIESGGAIYNTDFFDNRGTQEFQESTAGEKGGAIYNAGTYKGVSGTFIDNTVSQTNGTLNVYGGAIYNSGSIDMVATQNFEHNRAIAADGSAYGGAIYTTLNKTIKDIAGTFINNQAISTTANAIGGAIYNNGTSLNIGNVAFEQNIASGATAFGGAVYNTSILASADDTLVSFTANKVSATSTNALGGAIYNDTTGNISLGSGSTFTNNQADIHTSATNVEGGAQGGAVYNSGSLNLSDVNFTNNSATAMSETGNFSAQGGAIFNNNTLVFASGSTQDFLANTVSSVTGSANGGAVYNGTDAVISGLSGSFVLNTASSIEANVSGGAIFNAGTISSENLDIRANGAASRDANGLGGAIYNGGTFSAVGNFVANSINGTTAAGGAIYNQNTLTIGSGSNFGGNTAVATSLGTGGALANIETTADTHIIETNFSDNSVQTQSSGRGGAIYNVNANTLTSLTDTSLTGNAITITENLDQTYEGLGGAVYNNATDTNISRMEIISSAKDVDISHNTIKAISSAMAPTDLFYGGAIYNGDRGYMLISTTSENHTLNINNNTAGLGGAIYNMASGANVSVEGTDYSASLTVSAINGDININHNTATEAGGAIYNAVGMNGTTTLTASAATMDISENTASQSGGAVYNDNQSNLLLQLGDSGKIQFSENTALNGGAVYNNGAAITINNTTSSSVNKADVIFKGNTATSGAAIYNATRENIGSTISTTLKNTSIIFSDNTATSNLGGAIYNEAQSTIDINMTDSANVQFLSTNDNVYNLGTISFTGDSDNPTIPLSYTVPATTGITTFAAGSNATNIVLNSTFGGTGVYNVANTNLNLGSTGYIDYDPVINLSNNVITMADQSYINLSSKDSFINNDFNIAQQAVLTYNMADSETAISDVMLANSINNAGTINVADNVLTAVRINTLNSENGTIKIDLHDANATQNPLKADVITINNRIYGTTNVVFDNSDNVALNLGDKIYFAQTQSAQNLADYNFTVNAYNPDYRIRVGYDTNGALNDWYLYRKGNVAYFDLPRAAIEQSRGLALHINRTNRGECDCSDGTCTNNGYCKYHSSQPKLRLWATPFYRSGSFDKPVKTDFKLKGLEYGMDYQPTYSDLFGIFGSYRDGSYEHSGNDKKYLTDSKTNLDITSNLFGIYYRKYIGDFYMTGALYGGENKVEIKTSDNIKSDTKGLDIGGIGEIGYDIRTSRRSLLTPSVRATYDYIKFDDLNDNDSNKVKYDDVHDLELEAALKYEQQLNNEHQLSTTAYIKPSVIQTLASGGKVTINDKQFNDTLDNTTIGRIEVGADAELIENTLSVGAFGNYSFSSDYKAWGVGGNLRLVW